MQKGQYKVKVVTPIIDVETDKIKPIPSISLMHNFEFLPDGLKVWRAYKVGTGTSLFVFKFCITITIISVFSSPGRKSPES